MNYYEIFMHKTRNELVDPKEVLIVEKIIENMDHLYTLKLSDLAEMSFTSTTSITRFLKRLGFPSFSDFKEKVSLGYSTYVFNTYKDANIDETIKELDISLDSFDLDRLLDLARLILKSKTVTLIGSYKALEIFRVTYFTILAYDIPCFMFKKDSNVREHLSLLKEDDLVLYIHHSERIDQFIDYNPLPHKALLEVNHLNPERFNDNEIYHIVKEGTDNYLSLLLIGKVFPTYLTYIMEEEMNHGL